MAPKIQSAPALYISGMATRIRSTASMVPMSHGRLVRTYRPAAAVNEDVIDLYNRTPKGTKVIVLATAAPAGPLASNRTLRTW